MKTLDVIEDRHVLKIALNRPDVRNALSREMIRELTEVFRGAAKREGVRAVFMRGEGKVFCAGADLNDMQEMVKFDFAKNQADALELHAMFEAISHCPLPVVCEVHGAAFGGALGLIAASDVVIGENKTQYCFSEVKLGIAPALISEFVLRKTSHGLVAPWMMSGLVFSTAEAERMGLVHFAAELGLITEQSGKVLESFREAGPEAVRETKKLLQTLRTLPHDRISAETSQVIAARRVSAEGQEGLLSFLQKRTPSWRLS